VINFKKDYQLLRYLRSKRAAALMEFVDGVLIKELHIDISSLKSGSIYALDSDVINDVEKVVNSLQGIVRNNGT